MTEYMTTELGHVESATISKEARDELLMFIGNKTIHGGIFYSPCFLDIYSLLRDKIDSMVVKKTQNNI